ncbi:MAG: hypothetical protein QN137_14355 [Armatimonadota bacterium]|nr:hypothetical protein [Armatimonadota bacterium]
MRRIPARPGSRREGYGFPADSRLLRRRWYALAVRHLDGTSRAAIRDMRCFGDLAVDLARFSPAVWRRMLAGLLDEDDDLVPELLALLEAGRPSAAAELLERQLGLGAGVDAD